jgi:polyferredoxin
MKTFRRLFQLLFFSLFVCLLLSAQYPYKSLLPSELFLNISPLTAISTMLSTRSFIPPMAIAGIILLLTVPFGRFFCGWMCPLGTIIDAFDRCFKKRDRKNIVSLKYILLFVIILCGLFSMQIVWLLDPLSIITRSFVLIFLPALDLFVNSLFNLAFQTRLFEDQLYFLYDFFQKISSNSPNMLTLNTIIVFSIFLVILFLGYWGRRFWCRTVCPLGALFGLFSKYRITKRAVDRSCNDCGFCQNDCKMGAIAANNVDTLSTECILCGNCVSSCNESSVRFKFGLKKEHGFVDFSRRHFLISTVSGLAALALIKTPPINKKSIGNVRPPGSIIEKEFLDRCIRCMQCVKICSSTGGCLQPSIFEAGLEGLWSPISKAAVGYCEYNCNLCAQVCPTDAIVKIPLDKKQHLKMGVAYIKVDRCIPYVDFEDCLVCEEHCPTPEKAIKFELKNVKPANGISKIVKTPYVIKDLCIGCGLCEFKCPVKNQPGISITNDYEQRLSS